MKFNSHYRNIKTFEETNAMWHAYSKGVSKPWYATHVHAQDKEGEREREREREGVCVQWGQQRREIQCPTTTLVILNQTLAAPALSIIIAHEPQWKNSGCIFYCLPYNWYNLQTYVTTDDILLKFQSTTNEKKKKKREPPNSISTIRVMAEECTDSSVATSSSAPNWWDLHGSSTLSSCYNSTNPWSQPNPNSNSSCEEEVSISTSFTNASNHSGLTVESSRRLIEPASSTNELIGEPAASDSHLWSHVLL